MRRPLVSIVIRTLNEERHIGRLLSGIQRQTLQDFELIVVDSGSTDATLSIASRFPVEVVHIPAEEFSFGRSLNKGCSVASGEFLVFASAHVYPVYEDWLEKLTNPFDDPQVAAVYGKQRGDSQTRFSEQRIFDRWYPYESNSRQTHPFCNNANIAIRSKLWQTLPFNEELTGLEDIDWAKKVIGLGYFLYYEAEAEVIHVHDETPGRIYNRYRREAIAMRQIFPEESFRFVEFLKLFFRNMAQDLIAARNSKDAMRNLFEIPLFRLMQFWGTYRGFQHRGPISALRGTFYYPGDLPEKREDDLRGDARKIEYSSESSSESPTNYDSESA